MAKCPACTAPVQPGAKFCPYCGARLDGAMNSDDASRLAEALRGAQAPKADRVAEEAREAKRKIEAELKAAELAAEKVSAKEARQAAEADEAKRRNEAQMREAERKAEKAAAAQPGEDPIDDDNILLMSVGNVSKRRAAALLSALCGYQPAEAVELVEALPAVVARGLSERQANLLAQTLTEEGMKVSIYDRRGTRTLKPETKSVFAEDGRLTGSVASLLGGLGTANRSTAANRKQPDVMSLLFGGGSEPAAYQLPAGTAARSTSRKTASKTTAAKSASSQFPMADILNMFGFGASDGDGDDLGDIMDLFGQLGRGGSGFGGFGGFFGG